MLGMDEPPIPKIQVIASTIHCTWGEYLIYTNDNNETYYSTL